MDQRRWESTRPLALSAADDGALVAAVIAAVVGRHTSSDELRITVGNRPPAATTTLTVSVAPERRVHDLEAEVRCSLPGEHRCATDLRTLFEGGECVFEWRSRISLAAAHVARDRAEVLVSSIAEAVQAATRDRTVRIADLPLVDPAWRAVLLQQFRGARRALPDGTVNDLIAGQVAARPAAIACVFEDERLTYRDLDIQAETLAARLAERGAGRGDIAVVLTGNSLHLPVAILACLKLGAIFIPMDAAWPEGRLRTLLRDTHPTVILVGSAAQAPATERDRVVVCDGDSGAGPAVRVQHEAQPDDLAYAFPTSGSTGTPKCALNFHRGLLNRLLYMTRRFESGPHEVVLQNSRPVFDSSLWQLLWPLTNGGQVVIPSAADQLDISHTIELIERHAVTMTDFVPSVFNALVHHLEHEPGDVARLTSLRALLIGGEEIVPRYCRRFTSLLPRVVLTNTYGPTEASIGMVFHAVEDADGDEIPIGRPIDNTHAVVLDEQRRLVCPGMVGELYIGGTCLGAGYLNDAERTQQAWVPNPFPELDGDWLYRTGDLVRQRPDGMLYFLGRADRQVKIHGVRVELGEIERALGTHPAVKDAAVATVPTAAGQQLIGYVTSSEGVSSAELEAHLKTLLPTPMVPRRFVLLEHLPLTHNGKLDRTRLAELSSTRRLPSGAQTPDEEAIWTIWSELLERADFTIDDDFFLLGADSLLVLHLVAALDDHFHTRLPLRAVYDAPTIRQLASLLGGAQAATTAERDHDPMLAEADCGLLKDLPSPAPASSPYKQHPRCVLVTGATGFVGAHILAELLSREGPEVIAFARAEDAITARGRVMAALASYGIGNDPQLQRVSCVAGDFEAERFGLARAEWDELADRVDTIVNCAGRVDFLHDYGRHRVANAVGVAQLLRLAGTRRPAARVFHLSTLGACEQPAESAGGYIRSKWVAERLVDAARSRGYDVTVHRLGEVMPHTLTGQTSPRSLSHLLIRSCLILGMYPHSPVALDYSPVDWVAREVVDSVFGLSPAGGTFDLCHPVGTTLQHIMACAKEAGAQVEPVTGEEFYAALCSRCEYGDERALQSLRCLVVAAAQAQAVPDDIDAALAGLFTAPNDDSTTTWPPIDHEVLAALLAQISAPVGAHSA